MNHSKSKRLAGGFVLASCLLLLSSYTLNTRKVPATLTVSASEEYYDVHQFIWTNVCQPINEKLKEEPGGRITAKYISRCPSGYQPAFSTKRDSVKTDRFVNGRIIFYKGCNPIYVCHFKACVELNFVVVRSEGQEYLSVSAWIDRKNNVNKVVTATQIKG